MPTFAKKTSKKKMRFISVIIKTMICRLRTYIVQASKLKFQVASGPFKFKSCLKFYLFKSIPSLKF